jgi:hypothetical protein
LFFKSWRFAHAFFYLGSFGSVAGFLRFDICYKQDMRIVHSQVHVASDLIVSPPEVITSASVQTSTKTRRAIPMIDIHTAAITEHVIPDIQNLAFPCADATQNPRLLRKEAPVSKPRVPRDTPLPQNRDWVQMEQLTSITNLVGRDSQWKRMLDWSRSRHKPILMLEGEPGTGKTSMAHLLLRTMQCKIVETNASDSRSLSDMQALLRSFNNKSQHDLKVRTGYLFEEVDGCYDTGNNNGCISTLVDYVSTQRGRLPPIICTCNESWKSVLKILKPHTVRISFYKLSTESLRQYYFRLVERRQLQYNPLQVTRLLQEANGDIRQLIYLARFQSLMPHSKVCANNANHTSSSDLFSLAKKCFAKHGLTERERDYFQDQRYGKSLLFQNYTIMASKKSSTQWVNFRAMSECCALADKTFGHNMHEVDEALLLCASMFDCNASLLRYNNATDFKKVDDGFFTKRATNLLCADWMSFEFGDVSSRKRKNVGTKR